MPQYEYKLPLYHNYPTAFTAPRSRPHHLAPVLPPPATVSGYYITQERHGNMDGDDFGEFRRQRGTRGGGRWQLWYRKSTSCAPNGPSDAVGTGNGLLVYQLGGRESHKSENRQKCSSRRLKSTQRQHYRGKMPPS